MKTNRNLKNLTLTWAKDGKTLDFTFKASAGKRKVVMIEGWVSRHFDSHKYGITSKATPHFNPKPDWDFFGPKENGYNAYYDGTNYDRNESDIYGCTADTNRFDTVAVAIVDHFKEQWGIDFTEDEIRDAIPELTDGHKATICKMIADWAAIDLLKAGFKGSKKSRLDLAKEIAESMVDDGTCFSEKGYMETTEVGLVNVDGENVWNEVEYRLAETKAA